MQVNRIILIICLFLLYLHTIAQQPLFRSVPTSHSKLEFVNAIRENDVQNVLAYEYFYNGGGVSIGDINNDGLPDIFFTANIEENKLFLNLGNMKFRDISRQAGIGGHKGWKTGVTMADVNGDGLLDIYVCYSGKGKPATRKNELYINKGDLSFVEQATKVGLDDQGCSTQAVFFDYDIDGDLDMYLLNHNIKAYKNIELQHLKTAYDSLAADKLFRNDNGRFIDVSLNAGISGNPISFGLGVAVSDINNDGWPDIYVSNDYAEQDYLYINNGNGSFSQREHYMLSHLSQFSMGSDIADINNDGLVDILTLDMLPEDNRRQKLLQAQENYELYQDMAVNGFHYQFMRNMLHLNNGNGTFSEIGQLAGISNTDWSWSGLFADLDNDGFKDLYITNGYMRDYTNKDFLKFWGDYLIKQAMSRDSVKYFDIVKMMPSTLTANYVFKNDQNLHFTDMTTAWGIKEVALSNGSAYADLDLDGDLDLVVNRINNPAAIYQNESRQQLHTNYLDIRLKGMNQNSRGLGAKLYCYTQGRMQFLEQMPTRGYQSSVSDVLHFGLGQINKVDSLKIIWLNGSMQLVRDIQVNKLIELKQEEAKQIFLYDMVPEKTFFRQIKPIIEYSHHQLGYNDFKRQPLMPFMYSFTGPQFAAGDLNGDGLTDLVIGSSEGQVVNVQIQQETGSFVQLSSPAFLADSISNNTDVSLFDADGDKDLDLYLVAGGYHDYLDKDVRFQDRLLLNDGKGNFILSSKALPVMTESKSCIAVTDYDKDGDMDIFIGGRIIPGRYPEHAENKLLRNNGRGEFEEVLTGLDATFKNIGMVTDAEWEDVDGNGWPDLLLVGEWMAPHIFLNRNGILANSPSLELKPGQGSYKGWWNQIKMVDLDNDGDKDMIAGNWGLNTQIRGNAKEPVELWHKDFDDNGSIDPILCCFIQGKSYPYISRDELLDQLYGMRRKFTSYKSYADATLTDIFSGEELKNAVKLTADCLETMVFINENGKFRPQQLPVQAQFSNVNSIIPIDVNKDGAIDLLFMGNNEYPRLKIGKVDANFGLLLLNNGKGEFQAVGQSRSGLRIAGDVKDAELISIKGQTFLVVGINNNEVVMYKLME